MDPQYCKKYGGFSHKTSPLFPQTDGTVTVTVRVRIIINFTVTLIIRLSNSSTNKDLETVIGSLTTFFIFVLITKI